MKTSKSAAMFARVEEWRQSGQSLREFAETIGMSKSVLEYWVRRRRALSRVVAPSFVEVTADSSGREIPVHFPSSHHQVRSDVSIEITFPGGVLVKISG